MICCCYKNCKSVEQFLRSWKPEPKQWDNSVKLLRFTHKPSYLGISTLSGGYHVSRINGGRPLRWSAINYSLDLAPDKSNRSRTRWCSVYFHLGFARVFCFLMLLDVFCFLRGLWKMASIFPYNVTFVKVVKLSNVLIFIRFILKILMK